MRFAIFWPARAFGLVVTAVLGLAATAPSATAQGDAYAPTTWVDPDGCEHWAMDDGWRGYMDPRVDKSGKPVCRKGAGAGQGGRPAAVASDTRDEYVPTIWVDPDGCEHWVMDDGWRGYMDARIDRHGNPICRRGTSCANLPADQLFATGSARIGASGRKRLTDFFRTAGAARFTIAGHTDSVGADAANMRLSEARAEAVARIAGEAGAKVAQVIPYGERDPKASNRTAKGRAQNRRVEIFCLK